jgi:hypothetical protein
VPEYLEYERGRQLLSWRQVLNNHARLVGQPTFVDPKRWFQFWRWFKPDEPLVMRQVPGPCFYWSGLALPWSEATNHFFILGSPGSGKSLLLGNMMEGVLPKVATLPDHRAFLYDAKNELYPRLVAMGVKPTLLNPFDTRSVAWDIAADVETAAEAQQAAAILIPKTGEGKESFWVDSSRLVLAAVMTALGILRPGTWTLRDVLLVMRSPESIEDLLEQVPEVAFVWKNARGDSKTESNLVASFTSVLQRYEVVAALFEKAKTRISLRHWAKEGGGVLLVPNIPRYRETLAPLHRLLLQIIADETLSLPDNAQRRTFLFLDELRSIGRIESIYALANEGRSKGVVLAVGTQSIEGLQEVYGEKLAQEIIGQLRSKCFLRNDSHRSAKWVEDHIGVVQYWVEQIAHGTSYSKGGSGSSTTTSHSRRRESLILASEIMNLPTPKPGGHFTLVNDLPSVGGCFYSHYTFEQLVGAITKPDPNVPTFLERPKAQMRLLGWNAKDLKRLKLPPTGNNNPDEPTDPSTK